ncbi:MAG: hypothetical protein NZ583_06085 [Desulfobacterota bacterium]|nr:hypothetical protein [Thermodesulfobacteriota bacterium]
MAIKREVIEKIGGFDENFFPGNFEDDDFCIRAKHAGYETLISCESFVYHFGNRTFMNEVADYELSIQKNLRKLQDKWGIYHFLTKDQLIEKASKAEITDEKLVFPILSDTFFIIEWDKKSWLKKFDYYLNHPYVRIAELIVHPNGEKIEFVQAQLESYMKEKSFTEAPEIVLYDGKKEELLNDLKGRKYLIVTHVDLNRISEQFPDDVFLLFA